VEDKACHLVGTIKYPPGYWDGRRSAESKAQNKDLFFIFPLCICYVIKKGMVYRKGVWGIKLMFHFSP
jgi:hypothetical protein